MPSFEASTCDLSDESDETIALTFNTGDYDHYSMTIDHYDTFDGINNCDDAYYCLGHEFTCAALTNTYSWNCAGCACPGDTETSATDNWFDANLG